MISELYLKKFLFAIISAEMVTDNSNHLVPEDNKKFIFT